MSGQGQTTGFALVLGAALVMPAMVWAGPAAPVPKGEEKTPEVSTEKAAAPVEKTIENVVNQHPAAVEQTVSFDAKEKPLAEVLDILSRAGNVNIVLDKDVEAAVTLKVEGLAWRDALQLVADRTECVTEQVSPQLIRVSQPPRVEMDIRDADIRDVLNLLSMKSGVNIVVAEKVKGKITTRLVNVPWETALTVVTKNAGFVWQELAPNIIWVTTQEALEKEKDVTKTFVLNYARAEEAAKTIDKIVAKAENIRFDARTNTLVVTDTLDRLQTVEKVLMSLDSPVKEVSIDSKMINSKVNSAFNRGMLVVLQGSITGSQVPTTFPFDKTDDTGMGKIIPTTDPAGTGFPPGQIFPYSTSGSFTTGTLSFTNLQASLELMKDDKDTHIMSNPSVATLDNKKAKITSGDTVPIPIRTQNSVTGNFEITGYNYLKIGINLEVTPHITPDGFIITDIMTKVDKITGYTGLNNEIPITNGQEANSSVMVKDGDTIVIGGLIDNQTTKRTQSVPFLGDIPVMGWLFKKKSDTDDRTNLIIFITPRIMRPESSMAIEVETFRRLNQFMEGEGAGAGKKVPKLEGKRR
ncbi:MAG: secretin N-terminal domain-containing protein [Planctomycetota bacterium]